jgi:hypothetical protein
MSDERKDKPSASEMHRLVACPGSWNAKKNAPPQEASPEANSGTRIAAALLADDPAGLNTEESEMFDRLKEGRRKIFEATGCPDNAERHDEERMWSEGELFSGKPDVLRVWKGHILIIDDKSGRGHVEDASKNMQLRTLALLAGSRYPYTKVFVAINQPFAEGERISIAEYDADSLVNFAAEEIFGAIRASLTQDAKRFTGPHCLYCPARGTPACPESMGAIVASMSTTPHMMAGTDQLTAFLEWVEENDPEKTIALAKAELVRRIEAGEKVEGWEIKPGRTMEAITDPEAVFTRCHELGIKQADFLKAVKIGKGALKDVLADALKIKGKALAFQMDAVCAGAVTESQSKPSLVRVKAEAKLSPQLQQGGRAQ